MKIDPVLIREVSQRIDDTIKANRRSEFVIILLLVSLFFVGLGLIIYGVSQTRWDFVVPGGVFDVLVIFPVQKIIQLRDKNMKLQMLPQLLRLPDTSEAKIIAAEAIRILLEDLSR